MAATNNKVLILATMALLLDEEEQERKNKRPRFVWTRPWLLHRRNDGAFHKIFKELKEEDSDGFKGYVRMDVDHFDELVHLLSPLLLKKDTNMRECIKPEEMCCVTLRYLATGESFRSLEYQFRISKKAISYIVQEVSLAIIKGLGKEYLKTPNTTEEWILRKSFITDGIFQMGLVVSTETILFYSNQRTLDHIIETTKEVIVSS